MNTKKTIVIASILAFLVFPLFLMVLVGNHAFAGEDISVVTSGTIEPASQHVWTAEEMRAAKPYPLPALGGKPQPSTENIKPKGTPGMAPSGRPGDNWERNVKHYRGDVFLNEIDPLGYTYPFPFTRLEAFPAVGVLYNYFPYKAVGKVFFKQGGVSYVCSGASIGNKGVWTAGHCVYDPDLGTWATDFVFAPAYRDGTYKWGQWQAYDLGSLVGWIGGYWDFAYDIGAAKVNDIYYGGTWYRLGSTVGWLGFAWNWPREQHWNAMGYPHAAPFDGMRQFICQASHAEDDISFSPATIGIGCDQTPGCSGGPWILEFGTVGTGFYVNGNFSYHYIGLEGGKYSPYFGDGAYNLWAWATAD